ncbi:Os05g0588250 [Oryza sativa Japonica Group]|uniref:Os05g0588250 protein n=1 Tax=Oryza sativa subsp. japonica TaxID=39947 RepID=A0A0P0WRP0_ORYSJ|nr:hypothetical protein EE612_031440 [Oryza sativa]BAS95597.1 Os05g0588250 [Oryza sativa Japonica Group]
MRALLPVSCWRADADGWTRQRRRFRASVREEEEEAVRRGGRGHCRGRRGGGTAGPGATRGLHRGLPAPRGERRGRENSGGEGPDAAVDGVGGAGRGDVVDVEGDRSGGGGGDGGEEPAGVRGEGGGVQLRPGGAPAGVGGGAGEGERGDVVQGGAGGGRHGGGEAPQGGGGVAARILGAPRLAGQGGPPQPPPRPRLLLLQGREAPRLRLPPRRQPLRHAPRSVALTTPPFDRNSRGFCLQVRAQLQSN